MNLLAIGQYYIYQRTSELHDVTLYHTANFLTGPNRKHLQRTKEEQKMNYFIGNGRKYCREKERMLVTSIFSFSHNIFKRPHFQDC